MKTNVSRKIIFYGFLLVFLLLTFSSSNSVLLISARKYVSPAKLISDTWKGWYHDAFQGQCDILLNIKVDKKNVIGTYTFIIPIEAGPHFDHTDDSGSVIGSLDGNHAVLHLMSLDRPNKILNLTGDCVSRASEFGKDSVCYSFSFFGTGEDPSQHYYTCGSFYVRTKSFYYEKRPDGWEKN